MPQQAPKVRLTYDDFLRFPDDGRRHELIDGEHYVTPSPSLRHQGVVTELVLELGNHFRERGSGRVFAAPLDVVFSRFDVVEPDLVVMTRESSGRLTEANVQGAPTLVIEILSPSTRSRDRGIKRELYEKSKVGEYWIVDPVDQTVEVLRRSEGKLVAVESLARDGTLTSPHLPDLEIRLASVFRDDDLRGS